MTRRSELLAGLNASYVSANPRRRGLARLSPNLGFYARAAVTVLRCSEFGREGRLSLAIWGEFSGRILRAFERSGVPVIVENLETFHRFEGPCVIVGNHMSTTETFLPPYLMLPYRKITFVVKQGLIEYPVFKHIMRATHPIVVGRDDPRRDLRTVLDVGRERIEEGYSVIIFPQRTRQVAFRPTEFNSIGVKLARDAGVPVVPLAVKTDAWSTGTRLKDFGPLVADRPVHLALGEPIEVAGNGKPQNDAIIAFIQRKLAEWERWDRAWRAAAPG